MESDFDRLADVTLAVGAHLAGAALVLAVGFVLARILRRFVRHILARPQIAEPLGPTIVQLLIGAVYYLALSIATGLAVVALGVPATVVAAVALVLLAIIAIALRESIANFAATVNFLLFQPFRRGELIETMGLTGTVHEILLFNTSLLLIDQRLATLPNSKILDSGIINYSRMGHVRADFSLTVAYGEDLSRVREVIADIARQDARVLPEPPFELAVDGFEETGVRLLVLPTVAPEHFWQARGDLQERIKARFDREGISFAVARHDVRLAPGAAGGPAVGAGALGDAGRGQPGVTRKEDARAGN